MERFVRIATALFPLAFVPALVWFIAEGYIDLGGGELDLIWVIPYFLWSLLFAVSCFILWHRRWTLGRSLLTSAITGFGGVLLAAVVLALFGQLGVAGRF